MSESRFRAVEAIREMVESVEDGFDVFVDIVSEGSGWVCNRAIAEGRCRRMLNPRGAASDLGIDVDFIPAILIELCDRRGAPDLWTPLMEAVTAEARELRRLELLAQSEPEPRIVFRDEYDASLGFVYFVQVGREGPVKVGASGDETSMKSRLGSLQTANHETLHLIALIPAASVLVEGQTPVDCFATERAFHERFRDDAIRGEWFSPSEDLLKLARVSLHLRKTAS